MKYRNMIISPHIDDAFLSLGGLMIEDEDAPQIVINVFSRSNSAPRWAKPSNTTEEISSIRQAEELQNSKSLGVAVDFLGFDDASARGHSYWFGTPLWRAEESLIKTVRKRLLVIVKDAERVFFPLGIGRHFDHLIISRIGIEFLLDGADNIFFYEDMPYAARWPRQHGLVELQKLKVELKPFLIPIRPVSKFRLCQVYRSQFRIYIPILIFTYSKIIGRGGHAYERVWRIANTDFLMNSDCNPSHRDMKSNSGGRQTRL